MRKLDSREQVVLQGTNGLMTRAIIFSFLFEILLILKIFLFPDIKNLFSLKLPMTQSNLSDYAFVSNVETFIFFLLPAPFRSIQILNEYYYFHGNVVVCINSMRICSFYNRTLLEMGLLPTLWNDLFERDMHKFWMSPKSFKELKMTLEVNKKPFGGTTWYLTYIVHSCLSR